MRLFSVAAVAAVALLALGSKPNQQVRLPERLAVPGKTPVLLGIVGDARASTLVRVDRASLRPLPKPRLHLGKGAWPWAFSPDFAKLAVVTDKPQGLRLRLVDVRTLRGVGEVTLPDEHIAFLGWPAPGRLVVVAVNQRRPTVTLALVDPSERHIVKQAELSGTVVRVERAPDGLVLLLGPAKGIGGTRLATFDASGELRTVEFAGVVAGWDVPDENSAEPTARHRVPGLAVDATARRAFVVQPEGEVVAVDLRTLQVSRHTPHVPASPLARLGAWLESTADAKVIDGPSRHAVWLGGGLIAVTGYDASMTRDASGRIHVAQTPWGLRIVDTRGWQAGLIDPGADTVHVAAAGLLATGAAWTPDRPQATRAMGIAYYGADGAKRFHLLRGRRVHVAQLYGDRAFIHADGSRRMKVLDLKAGRIVGDRRQPLPQLLVGQSATS